MELKSYVEWRRTIPYTDDQIARALEQLAKMAEDGTFDARANAERRRYVADRFRLRANAVRRGRLSSRDLSYVLPLLITRCGLCDKPALYRYGAYGRCKTHKYDKPGSVAAHQRWRDQQYLLTERAINEIERNKKRMDSAQSLGRNMRTRRKA